MGAILIRMRRILSFSCVCTAWLSSACWQDDRGPCREGLQTGDEYRIKLRERRPTTTGCPADFDLTENTELRATVTGTETDGSRCAAGRVSIAPFGAWTWEADPVGANRGGSDLLGEFVGARKGCTGRVTLLVVIGSDELERRWTAESATESCPATCSDNFACQVDKLP